MTNGELPPIPPPSKGVQATKRVMRNGTDYVSGGILGTSIVVLVVYFGWTMRGLPDPPTAVTGAMTGIINFMLGAAISVSREYLRPIERRRDR